jgi:hypothetical protein
VLAESISDGLTQCSVPGNQRSTRGVFDKRSWVERYYTIDPSSIKVIDSVPVHCWRLLFSGMDWVTPKVCLLTITWRIECRRKM